MIPLIGMKEICALLLLVFLNSCSSSYLQLKCRRDYQSEALIKKLNDEEFTIAYNYAPVIGITGNNAVELLKLGKKAGCTLYRQIMTGKKVVISHILLSIINDDPKKLFLDVTYIQNGNGKEAVFTYNGLSWDALGIDQDSYVSIKKYWNKIYQ